MKKHMPTCKLQWTNRWPPSQNSGAGALPATRESWADLRKRVEECDDLLKNIKNVQKDMWKAIRENDPDAYGTLAAELVRESMTMTTNWLGIAAASKVALEMTEE